MKKSPAKKPTVKKQADEKIKPAKEPLSAEKKNLLEEVKILMEDINENGLKFLKRQAEVLLYNMKVEQVNTEIQKLTLDKSKTPKGAAEKNKDKMSMEIIDSDSGGSFIFVINKTRKFFTLDEMKKIVKICRSANDQKEASASLYSWFLNNRGDALYDIGINSANDPALGVIYNHIINNYTVNS